MDGVGRLEGVDRDTATAGAFDSSRQSDNFYSPERFAREQAPHMACPRGRLLIASCRAGSYLASRVVSTYDKCLQEVGSRAAVLYLEGVDRQFTDSETCVRLDVDVAGCDVFLFQALSSLTSGHKVDELYMAFLVAARAFREHGAEHVTAMVPYLAYGRQDKPTRFQREATTLKLMADLAVESGIDRVVTWHPHSRQIQGFYGPVRVDMLDPLNLFVNEFQRYRARNDVVAVAPDSGASKLVGYFSRALALKSAVAAKYRPEPEEAVVSEIIGDLAGKRIAIVLDDMVSSGGTVFALIKLLATEACVAEVHVGVSHFLGLRRAAERVRELHQRYGLQELVITDSIPHGKSVRDLPFVRVRSLAGMLASVINRIHYDRRVSELFAPELAECG